MLVALNYRDVAKDRYMVSDDGRLFKTNGRELFGCNPANEKGYVRITLVSESGKLKKYPVHRIVLGTFVGDSDLEVDHLDGNKQNNSLSNLEYVTGDENKRRAAANYQYRTCQDNNRAVLTDEQVEAACKLFEQGYNVRKVVKTLHLENVHNAAKMLEKVAHKKTWTKISRNYDWNIDDVRLKVYPKEHLFAICQMIRTGAFSEGKIVDHFPQYNRRKLRQIIEKVKAGKLYKSIMTEVERSTTIADPIIDGDGFYVLVPKR